MYKLYHRHTQIDFTLNYANQTSGHTAGRDLAFRGKIRRSWRFLFVTNLKRCHDANAQFPSEQPPPPLGSSSHEYGKLRCFTLAKLRRDGCAKCKSVSATQFYAALRIFYNALSCVCVCAYGEMHQGRTMTCCRVLYIYVFCTFVFFCMPTHRAAFDFTEVCRCVCVCVQASAVYLRVNVCIAYEMLCIILVGVCVCVLQFCANIMYTSGNTE